jgi:hypothetical protein
MGDTDARTIIPPPDVLEACRKSYLPEDPMKDSCGVVPCATTVNAGIRRSE